MATAPSSRDMNLSSKDLNPAAVDRRSPRSPRSSPRSSEFNKELEPPMDFDKEAFPANIARPDAASLSPRSLSPRSPRQQEASQSPPQRQPRRMSISDGELLRRALAHAFSNDGARSRPTSAVSDRRTRRTRFQVDTMHKSPSNPMDEAAEVFCLEYSPNSALLTAGCGDGSVRIFDASPSGGHHLLRLVPSAAATEVERLPITCLRFKPNVGTGARDSEEFVLLAAEANGSVTRWRIGEGPALGAQRVRTTSTGSGNSVYALAFDPSGANFAAAGRDHIVRLFDDNTGQLVRAFGNVAAKHGHSNRVYALCFHPTDPNLLLSGGWDNSVQFWDTRSGFSERSIFGPHLCGDALDIHPLTGAEFLTASWREDQALQRWDVATGKLIENVEWNGRNRELAGAADPNTMAAAAASSSQDRPSFSPRPGPTDPAPSSGPIGTGSSPALSRTDESTLRQNCMLYAGAYSPDGQWIGAGGSGNGVNGAKLFSMVTGEPTDQLSTLHALYALAFAPSGERMALGGVDPYLTVVNM